MEVGLRVGILVGTPVGGLVGKEVSPLVGIPVGTSVGLPGVVIAVGIFVGFWLRLSVGAVMDMLTSLVIVFHQSSKLKSVEGSFLSEWWSLSMAVLRPRWFLAPIRKRATGTTSSSGSALPLT
jgi:hypothetical protein